MASFIGLIDPDRRAERFIRLDSVCAVQYLKAGTSPTVTITLIGGESLKLTGAEAEQFLMIFRELTQEQTTRADPAAGP